MHKFCQVAFLVMQLDCFGPSANSVEGRACAIPLSNILDILPTIPIKRGEPKLAQLLHLSPTAFDESARLCVRFFL